MPLKYTNLYSTSQKSDKQQNGTSHFFTKILNASATFLFHLHLPPKQAF